MEAAKKKPLTQGNLDQTEARLRQLRHDLDDAQIKAHGRTALVLKRHGASDSLTAQLLCARGADEGQITRCIPRPHGVALARSRSNSQPPGEEGFRKEPLRFGVPRWAQKRYLNQHGKQGLDKGRVLEAKKPIPSGEKAAQKSGAATDDIDKLLREIDRPPPEPRPKKPKKVKEPKPPKPKKEPKKVKEPKPKKVKEPKPKKVKEPKVKTEPAKKVAPKKAAPAPKKKAAPKADADAAARAELQALLLADDDE